MPLLGERQQKFKLVNQRAGPFADQLTRCHQYHGQRLTIMQKNTSKTRVLDAHCIFKSPHFACLLIVFPYRIMRRLY
jgi:hypothetical protein